MALQQQQQQQQLKQQHAAGLHKNQSTIYFIYFAPSLWACQKLCIILISKALT